MKEIKAKILVVDDEYSFCKRLREFIPRLGYDVAICMNGEQALDLITEEKPDLMTLDIRMPGINGYDILGKLRASNSDMKVVVISAIDTPEMEGQLIRSGVNCVLRKPLDLDELAGKLKGLLG